MHQKGNFAIILAIVVVVVLGGLWLMGNKAESPVEKGPIKVGVLLPLTGEAAVYGEPLRNVLGLAADEINMSGGVNGRMLELIVEDAKCSGKDSASAAQKLINVDGVEVIIGGFCSSESLAAVPVAEAAKVALLSPGSSSPDLTGKSPYFFRNYPSDATQGAVLAEIAFTDKGWKKVAFIQEQLDYPLGIYKAFNAKFTELGGAAVKEEFASETTDFKTALAKLRAEKPDALFIATQAPAASERILKQLRDIGWKPKIMVADIVPGNRETVENYKDALEGALAAEFGVDPENEKFKHLVEAYKTKYGADVPYQSYAQTVYDAVYMVRDALLAVGEDGEKIAAWGRSLTGWQGASGSITIGADGDRASGHTAKMIKEGKVEAYVK